MAAITGEKVTIENLHNIKRVCTDCDMRGLGNNGADARDNILGS